MTHYYQIEVCRAEATHTHTKAIIVSKPFLFVEMQFGKNKFFDD